MKATTILAPMLALLLGSMVCTIPARPTKLPKMAATNAVLYVGGSDARLVGLMCREVARTGCFARIQCNPDEDRAAATISRPEEMLSPDRAYLRVTGELSADRSDWYRNSVRSLKYGTTAVQISRRSDLIVTVAAERGQASYRGTWTGAGRAGLYAYLPLYTGLISTLVGSTLDRSFSARSLAGRCNAGHADACLQYDAFLSDGLSRHSARMRTLLSTLGCSEQEDFL